MCTKRPQFDVQSKIPIVQTLFFKCAKSLCFVQSITGNGVRLNKNG